ncbi:MAG TPA: biotin transporter BioY [Armatimonadota bacterium]|nr:biotin transporter BioY [Armatimonadota bacterium]HOS42170.1 biotin transporter BioY [Armatimonadota bacterium]
MALYTHIATLPRQRGLAMTLLFTTAGALLFVLLTQVKLSLMPLTPVPFTGSVLAVLLLGGLLGPRLAPAAVAQYLVLGLVGLPVFAGFTGGIGSLPVFTGGYLLAFVPAALLYGALYDRFAGGAYAPRAAAALAAGAAAVLVIHLGGWAWLVGVLHYPPGAALAQGVLPFIPIDAGKVVLAAATVALWPRKAC